MNKMSGETVDLTSKNIEKLKGLYPEIISEGDKIDFDKLKTIMGNVVDDQKERYNFTWHGKKERMLGAQKPSKGTLRPDKEKSKDFDTTENLYIEGDNLETLKLLQKSYNNKVKVIYIDPPYNTGNDFVYKDDFKEGIENYLEQTGQVDSEGNQFYTNSESQGRYHSNWLNMVYPRLKLARNLLTNEGAIFVSIDNHEVTNLTKVLDEIFGEQNRISIIANIANPKGRSDSKYIATGHEYILAYARNIHHLSLEGFELEHKIVKRYNKEDEDGRKYRETDLKKGGFGDRREDRPKMFYYFNYDKETGEFYPSYTEESGKISIKPIKADGTEGRWRWGINTAISNLDKLKVRWMPSKKNWGVFEKDYLDKRDKIKAPSYWTYKDVNNERGVEAFKNLGFKTSYFDNPKPVGTIKRILKLGTNNDDNEYVLDFFSGSATAAHATMELNAEDGGSRKFIMVQLPEPLDEKSEAYKDGYHTICDVGEERIRRAGEKVKKDLIEKNNKEGLLEENQVDPDNLDIGFKVFKLDKSNIKEWNVDFDQLDQLDLYEDIFVEGRSELDVVYEILLKNGIELTYPVSTFDVDGKQVYDIAYGNLFICLGNKIDTSVAKAIVDKRKEYAIETSSVVFKDAGFGGNDSEKLNVIEILKDADYTEDQILTI